MANDMNITEKYGFCKKNRKECEKIKKMDHNSLNEYLYSIYLQGIEKGRDITEKMLAETKQEPDWDMLRDVIKKNVRGIGELRVNAVVDLFKSHISGERE